MEVGEIDDDAECISSPERDTYFVDVVLHWPAWMQQQEKKHHAIGRPKESN